MLSNSIETALADLADDIRIACTQDVKIALQGNLEGLQRNLVQYDQLVSSCVNTLDLYMKQTNDKMQKHLIDFEDKKRRFFCFDGAKNVFFWASQIACFGTLFLLIYFLFFKR